MSLRRMDIQAVIVGGGPVSSLVVLVPRELKDGESRLRLPIKIGTFEASAISAGVGRDSGGRPLTHDLFTTAIEKLNSQLTSVVISDVSGDIFFARVNIMQPDGVTISLDARPSDAIALALRANAPIFAEDEVISTCALPDFSGVEKDEKRQSMERFHDFIETLSPDDFTSD